jgi:HK97 family phage major capsid protein
MEKRLKEINARRAEIRGLLEGDSEISLADLTAELDALDVEEAEIKQRMETAARLSRGEIKPDAIVPLMPSPLSARNMQAAPAASEDPFDTPEYRNAFMNHVCRGAAFPAELRANATTMTTDVGVMIPTTTLQEIIKKLDSYGGIYALVRKLNIQGGLEVPILDVKPVAKWIGEGSSDDQKLTANNKVVFSYYGLECKIAQSLLASIVTFDMFQREFVPLTVEAIIEALEKAIFVGTGNGQALGITKDSRVPTENILTLTGAEFSKWDGWKKKVFAKMKKAYRNGIFVMAQGTFDGYIDGMVDTTGQPIGRVNYGITAGEAYRFGGKTVETVEDDVILGYDEAKAGDVVAVFFNPKDYGINSNMQMTVVKWTDHDNNKEKNKALIICDGKLLDPNGVLIIKKGAAS